MQTEIISQEKEIHTNRQYKDRLFKALFGSPERKNLTLQLYNAMNDTAYDNSDDIEISTIDDVIYMGMKNDVSFLIHQELVLWEQQSTPNPNMPLRYLLYLAHMLEKLVGTIPEEEGSIYSGTLVRIPTPKMVLFYNGDRDCPEYLYLSDAYLEPMDDPEVQLRIRTVNINPGKDDVLATCKPLYDYSMFVDDYRHRRMIMCHSDAAHAAIRNLPDGDVKRYLEMHEKEVLDMLLTEYDEEKTLRAEYYAGYETAYNDVTALISSLAEKGCSVADIIKAINDEASRKRMRQ